MRHQLISKQGLEEVAYKGVLSLEADKNYWLELKAGSRPEVIKFLSDFDFELPLLDQVEDPSKSTRINLYGTALLINLIVTDTADIYQSEYLTIIVSSNVLISILSEHSTLFDDIIEEGQNPPEFDPNLYHVLYYIFGEILQQGIKNRTISRQRIQKLSTRLDDESDSVQLEEIILCKREVSHLTNVVEDQYNMLGFVPKIKWTDESKDIRSELMEQVQGLEHLKNLFERLEEKVDAIHGQYQLILQEKGNKRLNTLTVIQSIFVPLTFLAGIYGMNFLFMPELKWPYSYYVVWGVIITITAIQLWLFKRKGWLD